MCIAIWCEKCTPNVHLHTPRCKKVGVKKLPLLWSTVNQTFFHCCHIFTDIYHEQFGVQLHTVNDVMQFCVRCGRRDRTLAAKVRRSGSILRPRGGGRIMAGRQGRNASMLTVFRLISLSVGLKQRTCRSACMYV